MIEGVTRSQLADAVGDARRSLTSTLAGLRADQWDQPSLCDGWMVRDVVGHLLHLYAINRAPYRGLAAARSGFRVNRFLLSEAHRRATGRAPSALLAALEGAESERTVTWKVYPWPEFVLAEFVVHAQDIRRPLGVADGADATHLLLVADTFSRPVRLNPFRTRLPPTHFEATDATWSSGDGPLVRGPLEAIVMILAGRGDALRDLEGDGVAELERVLVSGAR